MQLNNKPTKPANWITRLKINITGQMGRTRKTNYGFIEGLLIYFVVQLKQIHLFQSPTMKTQRQNTFSLKCQSVFPGKTK